GRVTIAGPYQEGELPSLLAKYNPHVLWFPAQWPETYSFTLSAAIESGLPIAASEIGAFPERLADRPNSWLIQPTQDPDAWLALFKEIAACASRRHPAKVPPRPMAAPRVAKTRTLSVIAIPERFDDGSFTPCAQIRLLRPLDHPLSGAGLTTTI